MKQPLICILLGITMQGISQEVFFRSSQKFSEKELESFYSSFSIDGNLILFNANDYHIYAYDKTTGNEKWKYYLRRKSNQQPFLCGGIIWTNTNELDGLLLDTNGKNTRQLPFSVLSRPHIKNGIAYLTGIYEAGNVLAYDLKKDSVLWYWFNAHGCSEQPYYFDEKIVANAESNFWVELDYSGRLLDEDCNEEETSYPSELSCVRKFSALSHDSKPFPGRFTENYFSGEHDVLRTDKNTFLLNEEKLVVFGDNLRIKDSRSITGLVADTVELNDMLLKKIIGIKKNNVYFIYGDHLFIYNFKKKKLVKMISLEAYAPHQAILDGDKLWMISGRDGLLYGLAGF